MRREVTHMRTLPVPDLKEHKTPQARRPRKHNTKPTKLCKVLGVILNQTCASLRHPLLRWENTGIVPRGGAPFAFLFHLSAVSPLQNEENREALAAH